jgi:Cu2+-exporting ATPase
MKHTYKITGMTCTGCKTNVESALNNLKEITKVTADLKKEEVVLEMTSHVSIEKLQETLLKAGLHYTIEMLGMEKADSNHTHNKVEDGNGVFYCPMHCEDEKTYDKAGSCPKCGMDLIEQPKLEQSTQYTCPMHPEVIKDEMGSCPICGMDLIPLEPSESEEDKTYKKLLKKMKIATVFTVPILFLAMLDFLPTNALSDYLLELMPQHSWNWVQLILSLPVVFYACWMFFERCWTSLKTMNLNMFTLIGIGTGVAWLFSLVAMFFPEVFPDQFKTESGTVFVYFEATTVILTLVLLGQLLEARAHSQTSGAIKELLKLLYHLLALLM